MSAMPFKVLPEHPDADLEDDIALAAIVMQTMKTPIGRRKAWAMLSELSKERTPRQVQQLENERGLR